MTETQTPNHQAALEYIAQGLAVIPLEPRLKTPATKHGLNDWSDNPGTVNKWWGLGYDFNVGIVCGQVSGGLVVIDLDAHGGADGCETLRDWEVANGELPETVTAITGSGGKHLLYRAPFSVRPSANGALGVDIRGDGSYIVAPPSIHPNGEHYEWSISPDDCDIATADDRVLAFIDYVRPTHADKFGAQGRYEPFALPERIGTGERNDTLFRYAAQLRSKEMGEGEILTLLQLANTQHCDPPMSEGELAGIVRNVTSRYAPGHSAEVRAIEEHKAKQVQSELVPQGLPGETTNVKDTGTAKKASTIFNMATALAADEAVTSVLRFDVHEGKPWKVGRLPMSQDATTRSFTDRDRSCLMAYVEESYGFKVRQCFDDVLNVLFENHPELHRDRLRDAMESLPLLRGEIGSREISWDGGATWEEDNARRAGYLLINWLDAEWTEYSIEVERLMFRQLVARAMHPGCKADHMVVLVGGQGIGKSTFVQALALDDSLFLPSISAFDEEHLRRLRGKLVVEVGELAAFRFGQMNAIKDVLTRQVDALRTPYAHYHDEVPRSCCFIGTTNEGAFLVDKTGNRRFLPVTCNATEIKDGMHTGEIERDIRIAYAETLAEYKKDEAAFIKSLVLPKEVSDAAQSEQERYVEEDALFNDIQAWVLTLAKGERVNVKRAYIEGLGYSTEDYTQRATGRNSTNDCTAALNRCEGLRLMKNRERVRGFGTSRAWERI